MKHFPCSLNNNKAWMWKPFDNSIKNIETDIICVSPDNQFVVLAEKNLVEKSYFL